MTERSDIERAFQAALTATDPYLAVQRGISNLNLSGIDDSIYLIAVGKAASRMMSAALDSLESEAASAFLITKDDHLDADFDDRVTVRFASHPVLDQRTLDATTELLAWLAGIPETARVLVLLSGGGSALLEQPVDSVPLLDFQTMTRELLHGGADIYQLNAVRSQVSQVKGGRLRQAIPASRVDTLALSDVLGNDLTVIASGPTVSPTRSRIEARDVLTELGVTGRMPESVLNELWRNDTERSQIFPDDTVQIIADNQLAIDTAAESLRSSGHGVQIREPISVGEAQLVARDWVRSLAELDSDISAAVSGGELTVTVRGSGTGGRNTEFALAAAIEIDRLELTDWTVASLATDGQDALTNVAGAIVDGHTVGEIRSRGVDSEDLIACNDTFPVLHELGCTVATGPTGTNVNDLYFAVRSPRR
jgi:glycerate 2-kinase